MVWHNAAKWQLRFHDDAVGDRSCQEPALFFRAALAVCFTTEFTVNNVSSTWSCPLCVSVNKFKNFGLCHFALGSIKTKSGK